MVVADIHGDIEKLYRLISQLDEKPDAVLVAGDLTPFGPASLVPDEIKVLKQASPKVLAVPGNEDPEDARREMEEINIHGKIVKLDDVSVIGFEGADWVETDSGVLMRYDPLHEKLKETKGKKIVLTHVPPFDTELDRLWTGRHVGSSFLRSIIEEYQPEMVISGHIHESGGVDKIGKTLLLNPGALSDGYSAWLEFEKDKEPVIVRMKLTKKGLKKEQMKLPKTKK